MSDAPSSTRLTIPNRRATLRPKITLWSAPPAQLTLPAGEIHLWRARLDSVPLNILLSADEQQRAARLRSPEKARQFSAGRTLLRRILGSYLGQAPATLCFDYGPYGKPCLLGAPGFDFNLAHSGDGFLLAISTSGPVGVDLERIDLSLDVQRLAAQFFTPEEAAALACVPLPRQRRAFYRLWTRKEALLKGEGCGFSGAVQKDGWGLNSLPLGSGYLGALAWVGEVAVLRRFTLGSAGD